jgi:hypothetical protein
MALSHHILIDVIGPAVLVSVPLRADMGVIEEGEVLRIERLLGDAGKEPHATGLAFDRESCHLLT